MDSHILVHSEDLLHSLGYTTLRFNFNTVGKPTDGTSEVHDVQHAVAFLKEKYQVAKMLLFGYSFGCGIGIEFAKANKDIVSAIIAIAPQPSKLQNIGSHPTLVIAGGKDSTFPIGETQAALENLKDNIQLVQIPEADHFFRSPLYLEEIATYTTTFLNTQPSLATL